MGLLTILSTMFQLGAVIHGSFDNERIKNESKIRSINKNRRTYIDSHGKEYDVHTDKRVYMTVDNGDKIYRDVKSNDIIYNISYEKNNLQKNNNREKAILEGKRFYYDPLKKLYCEIKTDKYYSRGNGFLDSYGDPYWDEEDKGRYVYEYGEGPTDEELKERERLYNIYISEKHKREDFGVIYKSDYTNNMDEYYNKMQEANLLDSKKAIAESNIVAFDNKMKEKYLTRKVIVK